MELKKQAEIVKSRRYCGWIMTETVLNISLKKLNLIVYIFEKGYCCFT